MIRDRVSRRPSAAFLFDDRSAWGDRLTGWERYTIEVKTHLAEDPDIHFTSIPSGTIGRRVSSDWSALPRMVRAGSPAGVIMPTYPPTPLMPRERVVWVLHDLTWFKYPEWSSRLGRSYYRPLAHTAVSSVAHIVTVSDAIRDELIRAGVKPHRVTRVYPGRPRTVAPPGRRPPDLDLDRPFALAVGSLDPRKNLELLYEAWQDSSLRRQLALVVAGRKAWGPSTPSWVRFLDRPSDQELAWLYSRCAVFVQPSLYEGFGLPVIEAASYGAPVACSDIPVFREVAPKGCTFFDPSSPESLRRAIKAALDNGPPDLGDCSRFDWSATARQLKRLCHQCLHQR